MFSSVAPLQQPCGWAASAAAAATCHPCTAAVAAGPSAPICLLIPAGPSVLIPTMPNPTSWLPQMLCELCRCPLPARACGPSSGCLRWKTHTALGRRLERCAASFTLASRLLHGARRSVGCGASRPAAAAVQASQLHPCCTYQLLLCILATRHWSLMQARHHMGSAAFAAC